MKEETKDKILVVSWYLILIAMTMLVGSWGISHLIQKDDIECPRCECLRCDCQFMIPAYQHQLEKEIERLKYSGTTNDMYNYGWEDALMNVSNLLK